MYELLRFHVDILSRQNTSFNLEDESALSDMDLSSQDSNFLYPIILNKNPESEDSAIPDYKGWADVKWLCTVGLGCVCGEECREEI